MDKKVVEFFTKNKLKHSEILYITRNGRKTTLTLIDGRILETYIPVKYLLAALPRGGFVNINKGIVISAAEIKSIDGNTYTMNNGKVFQGRVRAAGQHKANRQLIENKVIQYDRLISETIFEQFSIMDNLPLPFCVVEIEFNTAGHSVDFIFRYCNEAMAKHEGLTREEILDRSYYDLFHTEDIKWLSAFSEVAINGQPLSVADIHPVKQKPLTVHCFQPAESFCACLMIPEE